jgi:hypothetical protein
MVVFVVTVFIGLLNGQRVVKLSQDVLLTHVHAGTLGWITLSVFAVGLWLFGEKLPLDTRSAYLRWLSIIAAAAVPLYVLAFLSGNYIARATFGVPVLLVIIGFFGWLIARMSRIRLDLAHLAVLLALFVLIVGAVIGVTLQFQFATSKALLPDGAFAAHPASLVGGYLILIGMALSERTLIPATERMPRWGLAQMLCLFLSGLALAVGFLADVQPALALSLLLYIVGGTIFLVRMAPRLMRVNWLGRTSSRLIAISAIFIVFEIVLGTITIVWDIVTNGNAPQNLIIALDHTTFVGVMTNALFGLIMAATETTEERQFWPWADNVLFWGMNIGALGFIITLLTNFLVLERLFTPIMGLSILLGLLTYAIRLLRPPVAVEVRATGAEVGD